MPVQRTLVGRPVYLQVPPHRFRIVLGLFLVVFVVLLASSYSKESISETPVLAEVQQTAQIVIEKIPRPTLPILWNPFGQNAHKPPEEVDSTHGETKWFSDLKWLNPFSASVTLDENRAVLPPLSYRPPIYTFYDTDANKDSGTVEAEHQLILTWRRAWWAQGFKPIVLGRPEAQKSPLYRQFRDTNLDPQVRAELEIWLAWSHMGGGILSNWLALPMGSYDDKTLSLLRNGKYPRLTRYMSLQSGLFTGPKADIETVIRKALREKVSKQQNSVSDALPQEDIHVEPQHSGVAFYDKPTIASKYKVVDDQINSSQASGLLLLQKLINAHLHITWQNTFPDGIALLHPYPENTQPMVSHASKVARKLLQCPESPMPHTCPPNYSACKPCTSSSESHLQHPLTERTTFENTTSAFTVGVVPHPYTFNSMHYSKTQLSARFVRRETERDSWLKQVTLSLLGNELSGPQRLVRFKEAVASSFATSHSLWLTAEPWDDVDWNWIFGFALPEHTNNDDDDDYSETFDPDTGFTDSEAANLLLDNLDEDAGEKESSAGEERQKLLFARAIALLKVRASESAAHTGTLQLGELGTSNKWLSSMESRGKGRDVLEMVEAWNRADSEAWRFVRAFATRRKVERLKWEQDEKAFAGAQVRAKGWGSWISELKHRVGILSVQDST